MSYDFDFLSPEPGLRDSFLEQMKHILPELQVSQWEENTLSIHWNEVQVSFFSGITLKALSPLISYQHLYLLDKPDIIAMKIAAMMQRATIRDYFDIATLLQFENIALSQMIDYFYEKYGDQGSQFSKSLILKTLSHTEDVPEEDLRILSHLGYWSSKGSTLKETITAVLHEKAKEMLK